MAGHSKFKNIMHRKGAQDQKRAKIFTKIVREITVAAANGIIDPQFNPRLRLAMIAARNANLPKDRVEAAIKKSTSSANNSNYEEMRYEGYGIGGVAIIVETLTDNRNRTASDVRSSFTKFGGTLGETGSVSYMFNRLGFITYPIAIKTADQMVELAIEAGAVDCQNNDQEHEIFCALEELHSVREALEKMLGEASGVKLIWQPSVISTPNTETIKNILKLIDHLEDLDDVQNVFTNLEIPDDFVDE